MYYFLQGGVTRSERFDAEPTLEQINEFFGRVRLQTIRLKRQVNGKVQLLSIIDINEYPISLGEVT